MGNLERLKQLVGGQNSPLSGKAVQKLLSAATRKSHESIVTFLLKGGADPNQDPDVAPYPIAAVAAFYGDTDAAALLLRYGARMKHSGALSAAAARGNETMLRYLLENGADHENDCVLVGRPVLALHVAANLATLAL